MPARRQAAPRDKPPPALTAGLGLQFAILPISGIVPTQANRHQSRGRERLVPDMGRARGRGGRRVRTILQAVRLGRIGTGHVLLMETSGAFIAVCVAVPR